MLITEVKIPSAPEDDDGPMNIDKLKKTHADYDDQRADWEFFRAAYGGTKKLVDWGIFYQYEDDNQDFERRKKAAWGFNFSETIVDLTANFISGDVPFEENMGEILENNSAWQAFARDCDLWGSNWDGWWAKKRKKVGSFGLCGILVDKATGKAETQRDQIDAGIYPYLAYYSPLAILDWQYERNRQTNRPELNYLKLFDDDETYRLWYPERWEAWKIIDDKAVLTASGDNPLGLIPWVWFLNIEGDSPTRGLSDIKDIANIDASIVRAASSLDEVVIYTGFPMLLTPKGTQKLGDDLGDSADNGDIKVGAREVIEFDPENPTAIPSWLAPSLGDAVSPMLELWDKQAKEMYRMAALGSLKATESNAPRSGESQKETFKFLKARLSEKVDMELEARLNVMKFWLLWENLSDEIMITHSKKFDIETFLTTVQDFLTAKTISRAPTYIKALEKEWVQKALLGTDKNVLVEIVKEIEAGTVIPDPLDPNAPGADEDEDYNE